MRSATTCHYLAVISERIAGLWGTGQQPIDARHGCQQDEDVPMSKLSSFVWSIADQLRGPYHQHEYGLSLIHI